MMVKYMMKILENVTEFKQKLNFVSIIWKPGIYFSSLEHEKSAAKTALKSLWSWNSSL